MAYNKAFSDTFGDIFTKALESLSNVDDVETIVGSKFVPIIKEFGGSFGAVDIVENEGGIRLAFDVPGTSKKDVKLELVKNNNRDHVLKLVVQRKTEKQERGRFERFSGTKNREVALPFDVDPSSIVAKHEDGVLYVSISKQKHESPSQSIPIL